MWKVKSLQIPAAGSGRAIREFWTLVDEKTQRYMKRGPLSGIFAPGSLSKPIATTDRATDAHVWGSFSELTSWARGRNIPFRV